MAPCLRCAERVLKRRMPEHGGAAHRPLRGLGQLNAAPRAAKATGPRPRTTLPRNNQARGRFPAHFLKLLQRVLHSIAGASPELGDGILQRVRFNFKGNG